VVARSSTPTSLAIRAYRGRSTQKDLAALVDVDSQTVSRWERGLSEPGPDSRERLLELGVELPAVIEPPAEIDRLERIEATLERIEATVSALRAELAAARDGAAPSGDAEGGVAGGAERAEQLRRAKAGQPRTRSKGQ
jgi:transcriptional regulator with XRE-family HTH domain